MATTGMLEVSSTVRGYHVYKRRLDATIGEVLQAEREGPRNVHDRYSVTLTKEGLGTVGHVHKKISKLCNSFLARGGEIEAVTTGSRQYADDLPQGGLDVLCKYIFSGDRALIQRLKHALRKMNIPVL